MFVAKDLELKSEEVTIQGVPIATTPYALGISALQSKISLTSTGAKHITYADNLVGQGSLQEVKKQQDEICKPGSPLG